MKIMYENPYHNYEFEIVEKIPESFQIWNINMIDGYLPLTELEDVNNRIVNVDTLKAILIKDSEELRLLKECGSYGVYNLDKCKRVLNYKPRGWLKKKQIELAKQAIRYFEELTEKETK